MDHKIINHEFKQWKSKPDSLPLVPLSRERTYTEVDGCPLIIITQDDEVQLIR